MNTKRHIVTLFYILLFFVGNLNICSKAETLRLRAATDAYVWEKEPTRNLGASATLLVGNSDGPLWSYVKWNLLGTGALQNATINSVSISMHQSQLAPTPEKDVTFLRVSETWDEGQITWNSKPATVPLGLGLYRVPAVSSGAASRSVEFPDSDTASLKQWVSDVLAGRTEDNGLAMIAGSAAGFLAFDSSEDSSSADRPTLEIDYTPAPKRIDLELQGFAFAPGVIAPGAHPEAVDLTIMNRGPDELPAGQLTADFFLSRDETFGNSDDITIGNVGLQLDQGLPANDSFPTTLTETGRAFVTLPTDSSGNYTVFVLIRRSDPSGSVDPEAANNFMGISITVQPPPRRYQLALAVNPVNGGSISPSPAIGNDGAYPENTVVQLTAAPSQGYRFVAWSGAISGSANPANVTMSSDKLVTANFELIVVECFVSRNLPDYVAGSHLLISLAATPPTGTASYAVEDTPPVGWVVSSPNNGGEFDATSGRVKFGPFFDSVPRTFTYLVTPPVGTSGEHSFAGSASKDGLDSLVCGDSVTASARFHPADANGDWRIVIGEVTGYGAAWKRGNLWPTPPNPIPISYVTRLGFLWKKGETYRLDPAQSAPLWWVPTFGVGGSANPVRLAATTGASRSVEGSRVMIQANPPSGTVAYAVEESLPAGFVAAEITEGGEFDVASSKVKWGPFFDSISRTLAYTLSSPPNFEGKANLSGVVSFDGVDEGVSGEAEVTFGDSMHAPKVSAVQFAGVLLEGSIGKSYRIEYTEDLNQQSGWTTLTTVQLSSVAVVPVADLGSPSRPKRFYRAIEQP